MPTALWVLPDGDGLAFWTARDTGKVKRIRNNGRVTVAACDFRGNPSGPDAVRPRTRRRGGRLPQRTPLATMPRLD